LKERERFGVLGGGPGIWGSQGGHPGFFWGGGGLQQLQLRTEGRGNGNLGSVAP